MQGVGFERKVFIRNVRFQSQRPPQGRGDVARSGETLLEAGRRCSERGDVAETGTYFFKNQTMQIIPLQQMSGQINVHPAQIVRIESSSNYSRIFFINRAPLVVCKILQWFEDLLPVETFARVHRSHLVNRAFITDLSDENYLQLQNGETIPVSRRKRKAVGYGEWVRILPLTQLFLVL